MIDATAIVHSDAILESDVKVGAYSIIGANVFIGTGSVIGSHVVINGPTTIGPNNKIFQFCSIGEDPQDKKFKKEKNSILEIGAGNTIREYVSINRGTDEGGGKTIIGDNNWIMAYAHIAHDCFVGNNTVFANNASIAGHVVIEDFVILGALTVVHQYCRVGSYSFSAFSSVILKDVPPYILVSGNSARPSGLNREGLKRHGFNSETINILRKAYKAIYRDGRPLKDALNVLSDLTAESDKVEIMRSFIACSDRGIVR